jgi:sugar lactone lactonase YvrE
MKYLLYILLFSAWQQASVAQNVGIGTALPNASAVLDLTSTSKGMLVPRLTAAQRSGIVGPATGLLVFQTDGTAGFYWYNGTAWMSMTTGEPIASNGHSAIWNVVLTYAGSTTGYADGVGTAAQFANPAGMVTDKDGNLYVADQSNNVIRKIYLGGYVTTFEGDGVPDLVDGQGNAARFNLPMGMAMDAAGTIYVADANSNAIRKITPDGNVTTFVNGINATIPGSIQIPDLMIPLGVAVDASDNIYFTEYYSHRVRKITPAGVVSVLAGAIAPGHLDDVGTNARFKNPVGIAVDAGGTVYVADGNNCIRKILPNGSVSTLAGSDQPGFADGIGSAALFNAPKMITLDASGAVYVADLNNNRIRKVIADGTTTTVAGTGVAGKYDAPALQAKLNQPYGVVFDGAGNMYISERGNNIIRKINRQ